ncbi:MAG: NADH:flavin oxidoreductase [Pseudanabaenales cyanobacterium]|nr:NADH:flavin oxidoreductase [Pseudanabaenales cyanobacterium]
MSTDKTLLDPIHFRNLTVKNRVFRSSVTGRWDNYDGSGNQVRVNWENKFAQGGVGAIISSYVPISREGQITPQVATIDEDSSIPFWRTVGEAVHQHSCKYILQLSHSGRQRDIEGIENTLIDPETKAISPNPAPSATDQADQVSGLPANHMSRNDIHQIIQKFADGAGRAKEAGLDGVELHSSHGYLINQFLSAGINRRTANQGYGGDLKGRYQFLKEIVQAIRKVVGNQFHLQAKISVREFNNILPPWAHSGNTFDNAIQICKWLEEDGVDAIHVSRGSTFPHPLLPSGPFPFEMLNYTADSMVSSSRKASLRNLILFRYRFLHPIFQWIWGRLPRKVESRYEQPVNGLEIEDQWLDEFFKEHVSTQTFKDLLKRHQGTLLRDAKVIKDVLQEIPIITTGGFQQASYINAAIQGGYTDAVSMARMLVANNDLVKNYFEQGLDIADRPCTYCNNCLGAYLEVPLGCHDIDRYYQRSINNLSKAEKYKAAQEALRAKNDEVMSVFKPRAKTFIPPQENAPKTNL